MTEKDRAALARLSTPDYWVRMFKRLAALDAAARDFVKKCDEGRAKSKDSYAKFKAALEI